MREKNLIVIFLFCLTPFLGSFKAEKTDTPPAKKFVVVLDAGHGGHDPGNLGNGFLEKNIALNIVLNVGEQLEENPNIQVIYTRNDDTFVDLYKRGEIANQAKADLFVSVHCDSHNSDAYGAGTYVLGLHANEQNFEVAKKENSVIYLEDDYEQKYAKYDINSPESLITISINQEEFLAQSVQLAKLMQDNFTEKIKRKDRKVKQAGFIVLHQTFMPSVLVETGFLTNKEEGTYLNSRRGQMEMAESISGAIVNYLSNVGLEETASLATTSEISEKETVVVTPPIEKPIEKPTRVIESVKEEVTKPAVISPVTAAEIQFKVQIMASAKNIPLEPSRFNGLSDIAKEPYKNLYRYVYGKTPSYQEAQRLKRGADASGYTSSYIVAYKNGERIPVPQALKYLSKQ